MKRGFVAGLAVLLSLVLLGACAEPVSSSEASSLFIASSSLVSSQEMSSQSASSPSSLQPVYDTISPTVPEGELVPVTDIAELQGSWYHEPGPVIDGPEGWPENWSSGTGTFIYLIRFSEYATPLMLAFGKMSSDDADFFNGDFVLGSAGVLTITLVWRGPEGSDIPFNIEATVKVEKSEKWQGLLVFTFLTIQTDNIIFETEFGPLLNVPVAFVNWNFLGEPWNM